MPNQGVVLLEGFCLLSNALVRESVDIVIWIDVDQETCRQRRKVSRFPKPSGWDFAEYFDSMVWPAHTAYAKGFRRAYQHSQDSVKRLNGCLPIAAVVDHASRFVRACYTRRLGPVARDDRTQKLKPES